jgi:hypothetical protein
MTVIINECGDLGIDAQDHRAAIAPIPAIRATQRLELLPVDRSAPMPSTTACDVESYLVHKGWNGHLTPSRLRHFADLTAIILQVDLSLCFRSDHYHCAALIAIVPPSSSFCLRQNHGT